MCDANDGSGGRRDVGGPERVGPGGPGQCAQLCLGVDGGGFPPVAPGVDHNEHLRQAADHLQAAGLTSLADHVRSLAVLPSDTAPVAPHRTRQDPRQILLAVKVLEIAADKLDRLGLGLHMEHGQLKGNFMTAGPVANVAGVTTDPALPARIDALRKDCLVQVLAEPTLVTVNNRPGSFFSGSQLAIPTIDAPGDSKPEYKKHRHATRLCADDLGQRPTAAGTACKFTELDPTHSVTVHGFVVPGMRTFEVETGVEMEPGQTLVAQVRRRRRRPIPKRSVPRCGWCW